MPPEADLIRIRHMVDAGREAIAFCQGRSRADLDTDLDALTKRAGRRRGRK